MHREAGAISLSEEGESCDAYQFPDPVHDLSVDVGHLPIFCCGVGV